MIRCYKLICVLGVLMCGMEGKAQQIIWSEIFDNRQSPYFPPPWRTNGWTCDNDMYIASVCAPKSGNPSKVAGISGYLAVSRELCGFRWVNQTDMMLETPLIDVRGRQHPRLRFDSYFLRREKNGRTEYAAVEISTDSGATWTVLKLPSPTRLGAFNTCMADLSPYAGAPGAIRLGFRYTDSLEYMPGWLIDNLQVLEPLSTDLALIGTSQDDTFRNFHVVPATVNLEGRVVNFGTAPVTEFTAHWQDGSGPVQSERITGINLQPMDTLRFTHGTALDLNGIGIRQMRMWVTVAGDLKPANDSVRFKVSGSLFAPKKKLVIEEGTGNWNIGGPRGDVFLHRLDTATDVPIRISVHSGDVLEHKPYADHLYYLRQLFTHYFLFDRRDGVHPDAFFNRVQEDRTRFGFADLDMKMNYNAGVLDLEVDVHPAVDLPGKYRVAMILTEDGVRGTIAAYNQANGFTDNKIGPMGGYEARPDPVPAADMRYDYVARVITPGPEGKPGAIPADPKAGQHYKTGFLTNIGISWKKPDLNVIALLIRESDSSIVNATSRRLSSLSLPAQAQLLPDARLQPNPAHSATQLYLDLPRSGHVQVSIVDISGRVIATPVAQTLQPGEHRWTLSTDGIAGGMYLVRITGPGFQQSLKLSVVR